MKKILANDGISKAGIEILEKEGFKVDTNKVDQEKLVNTINSENYEILLVRSATSVKKDIINKCPKLKIIGRGGVGMDNIDVKYAKEKGIHVINTPSASSISVAELVFAHMLSMSRFLSDANRQMPLIGDTEFKTLKKSYSKAKELEGKTIGIIGFGRIGQSVAKKAIGFGMRVLACDKFIKEANITLKFFNGEKKTFTIITEKIEDILKESDFITIHIPKTEEKYLIGADEIGLMKNGAGIINTSRGGLIDEDALIFSLEKQKLAYAGLDVFNNEPTPSVHLLMQKNISLSPHIGGATIEAQERIGTELANQIIKYFKK